MKCIKCGAETRYNRAVVHLEEGSIVGGICSGCEPSTLGRVVDGGGDVGDADDCRCEHCVRPPVFAYPEHKLDVSAVTGAEYVTESYDVDAETPVLCAVHALFSAPVAAGADQPVTGTPR